MFVDDGFARFAKVAILLSAASVLVMSQNYMARRGLLRFEYPHTGRAGCGRHDDDGQRGRPDGALHGAGTAVAVALRGRRAAPRQRQVDRGGAEVFRAGRAQLGAAALWRLADLRLCRHHALQRHHPDRAAWRGLDRASLRHGVPDLGPCLQGQRGAVPHVDARCLRGLAHAGHRVFRHRPQGRGDGALRAGAARRLRRRGGGLEPGHRASVGGRRCSSARWRRSASATSSG